MKLDGRQCFVIFGQTQMAETGYSSPFTIGVLSAAVLILGAGLLHLWRKIFKYIKKRNESEVVAKEIRTTAGAGERRVSSSTCVLVNEHTSTHPGQQPIKNIDRKKIKPCEKRSSNTLMKKEALKFSETKRKTSFSSQGQCENLNFLAGLSHHQNLEECS